MSDFRKKVYEATAKIPKSKVSTYGLIACLAGNCKASRAVGSALGNNASAKVPCHRVIKSDGSIGGYRGKVPEKIVKLENEGIIVKNEKIDLNKYCWPAFAKATARHGLTQKKYGKRWQNKNPPAHRRNLG